MARTRTLMPAATVGLVAAALIVAAGPALATQTLVAARVDAPPTIDGLADDPVWARAAPLVTRDELAGIDITIRSVFTDDSVYMLVTFPDPTENRDHKTRRWVPEQERYRTGPDREDTFVFKWSMEPGPVDLSITSDQPYKADIWFWKAHRTDPSGYADDKMHVYSALESPDATRVLSRRGLPFYLTRPGDDGRAAYRAVVRDSHVGDSLPGYDVSQPEGSRADIRAKGAWRDGVWTVEFGRKLVTGHIDDVELDPSGGHRFGVSRFEIAGRRKNPAIDEPYYGVGDVGETLVLRFQARGSS